MKKNNSGYYLLLILALTTALYINSLTGDFTNWDDNGYITENELIKDFSWSGIKKMFTTPYMGNYHPLTGLSNMIEFHLWGLKPAPYHVFNLLLHLLNTILVFYFFRLLIKREHSSLLIALFFAIHPMHVESVSWLSERKDVLYAFFYLLSLLFFMKWGDGSLWKSSNEKKTKSNKLYGLSFLFFSMSLLSKSMAVTLPLLLLLIIYHKNDYSFKSLFTNNKILLRVLPFILLSVVFGIIAINTQQEAMDAVHNYTFVDTPFIICYELIFYLFKLFLPINLSALHPYPIKTAGMLPVLYYLSIPIIILLSFSIHKFLKKYFMHSQTADASSLKKEFLFGILFFLFTISVALQFVPFGYSVVSERYAYIPYLGLILSSLSFLQHIIKNKTIIRIAAISFIVFFSISTFNRNKVWANSITLFSDIIENYPATPSAYLNRGMEKYKLQQYTDALNDYNEAIKIVPDYFEAHYNRGLCKYMLKDFTGALSDYDKAIGFYPKLGLVYYLRGVVKNDLQMYDGAIKDYTKAIDLQFIQKDVHRMRGDSKFNKKDFAEAIKDYDIALTKNNNDAALFTQRALAKYNLRDYKGAISDFNISLSLNPADLKSLLNRGIIKGMLLDYKGAISDFSIIIERMPDIAEAYYNRGYAYIALNKTNEACTDLQKALSLGYAGAKQLIIQHCR